MRVLLFVCGWLIARKTANPLLFTKITTETVDMKLNPDLLLGEITTKYGGTSYSSVKVSLAYDCIFIAQEWFDHPKGYPIIDGKSHRYLKKDLKRYVRNRICWRKYNKRHGFIPSFVWWFIARAVINWIINRIIDHYL